MRGAMILLFSLLSACAPAIGTAVGDEPPAWSGPLHPTLPAWPDAGDGAPPSPASIEAVGDRVAHTRDLGQTWAEDSTFVVDSWGARGPFGHVPAAIDAGMRFGDAAPLLRYARPLVRSELGPVLLPFVLGGALPYDAAGRACRPGADEPYRRDGTKCRYDVPWMVEHVLYWTGSDLELGADLCAPAHAPPIEDSHRRLDLALVVPDDVRWGDVVDALARKRAIFADRHVPLTVRVDAERASLCAERARRIAQTTRLLDVLSTSGPRQCDLAHERVTTAHVSLAWLQAQLAAGRTPDLPKRLVVVLPGGESVPGPGPEAGTWRGRVVLVDPEAPGRRCEADVSAILPLKRATEAGRSAQWNIAVGIAVDERLAAEPRR